ncbi:MAG TPA: class I SAM-dependent methyltransferase [Pyrinomonadaceae bacterium]|jgi:predicted O-methyltransferase YrrM|nr:class I SAM-dependent methyltransferase [Pyrinomonadaceae bacterium]
MLNRTEITPAIYDYVVRVGVREPDVLRRLHEETAAMPEAEMMIPPEQGQFLNLLVKMINAKKTLDVGVFTGYSSLWAALALPENGQLFGCDVSGEWTSIAQRYWREAGVSHKCQLLLGPASATLDKLIRESHENTFDFAFIDADKVNYDDYYEKVLKLVRSGGVIAIDNVFRSGEVLDPTVDEPGTISVTALNEKLSRDERISLAMLTVADGLTLAVKR